ncbi:UNVERIFIED_CONTAM: hypothetical protein PYX00_007326 [Menopon gallinae]|uniref:Uncharacterized protein n=1 Tax=Menopon gallinae TaxID=328185 RepID=A0AAW2HJ29_9NEOP
MNSTENNTQKDNTGTTPLSNSTLILTSLAAGALAGALAKSAIAPFDRCKITFQISNEPYSNKAAFQFVKNVVAKDGFLALWRGNSATMARILPYAAIQFTAHEQWKKLLNINDPKTSYSISYLKFKRFLAGSLAGVTSQSITYPLDLARARMAVTERDQYPNLTKVIKTTFQKEGIKGLFRGYIPTVLGVIPYAGASFFSYETLKQWFYDLSGGRKPGTRERLFFGAMSGICGQTLSYPLDIVRRRMQTAVITKNEYPTILSCLKQIYKKEGFRKGFFKGLSMNWIKGPIAVGISFATYDRTQELLRECVMKFV